MVLSGISKNYDGVAALTDVSLEIRRGEVHALLGENGAGKSTLMGVASGAVSPDAGTITGGTAGHRPADAGPGHPARHRHRPPTPRRAPDMTVAENIAVAVPAEVLGPRAGRVEMMRRMLADVGSSAHLERPCRQPQRRPTPPPRARQGACGRALSCSSSTSPPRPLGPDSVDMLFERVRRAAASGTAVVYITHRLAEVRELADRVTVLRDGKVRGTADVDDITDDELLAHDRRATAGVDLPAQADPQDELPTRCSSSTGSPVPASPTSSFTARRGEIIGVSGIVGNGQSDVLRALAGLEPSPARSTSAAPSGPLASCASSPPTCLPTAIARA